MAKPPSITARAASQAAPSATTSVDAVRRTCAITVCSPRTMATLAASTATQRPTLRTTFIGTTRGALPARRRSATRAASRAARRGDRTWPRRGCTRTRPTPTTARAARLCPRCRACRPCSGSAAATRRSSGTCATTTVADVGHPRTKPPPRTSPAALAAAHTHTPPPLPHLHQQAMAVHRFVPAVPCLVGAHRGLLPEAPARVCAGGAGHPVCRRPARAHRRRLHP
jgi:hypothetical protein